MLDVGDSTIARLFILLIKVLFSFHSILESFIVNIGLEFGF